jgi:hypothetical protein
MTKKRKLRDDEFIVEIVLSHKGLTRLSIITAGESGLKRARPIVKALEGTIRDCFGGTLSAPTDIIIPMDTLGASK